MTDKERIEALRAALNASMNALFALRVGQPADRQEWILSRAGEASDALRADDEAARQGEPSPGEAYRPDSLHGDEDVAVAESSPPGPPAPPTRGMWGEGGAGPGRVYCDLPPDGWRCTRERGHEGPCAAVPENDMALESIERLQAQVAHLAGRLGEAHRERDALARRLESITPGATAEPSPEAREAAREFLDNRRPAPGEPPTIAFDLGFYLLQRPEVREAIEAAIRDELGGGAS
jgi:hypothetical protein